MVNILIVDDSITSRKFLRQAFESNGHAIIGEAVNGAEAVEKYKELKPDVVTMDITMPVMDGIEALREIMLSDPDAKVIMVTTAGQKSNILECIKLGAVEFIQKPFDRERINELIDSIKRD